MTGLDLIDELVTGLSNKTQQKILKIRIKLTAYHYLL